MASLTIKGIPDELLERLRQRAELHRRSMNSEVIVVLEEGLGLRARARKAVLAEVEDAQRHLPWVEHEAAREHIRRGRR
ncbi:MAG TPA: Arc family DNA-binding protein [Longimicrobiales bacterium]